MKKLNVVPLGYLRDFLIKQKNGLTGNIEKAGYPFNEVEWGKSNFGYKWYDFEQVAYWLDGYTRLGILLDDKEIINRSSKIIYNVIDNPTNDDKCTSYLGPTVLRFSDGWCRWPHVVFFRAALALYEYNQDYKIIDAIKKHYLNDEFDYSNERDVLNVEIMLNLYSYTKDERLLNLAIKSYSDYNEKCKSDLCDKVILSNKKPYVHGVSYDEYTKLSSILYLFTKDKKYLKVAIKANEKLKKHFMLIDGLHCSDEFLINNKINRSHETCCVSDYTWNLYYLYQATKNTNYLDDIEKCIFNAGIGSVNDDFRALQYFSSPNQITLGETSNHNDFHKGSKWMQYAPNPGTECCPGNVNRFMPNYIMNIYGYDNDYIEVKLFGSSILKINGKEILKQETNFPFGMYLKFTNLTSEQLNVKIRYPSYVKGLINENNYKINDGYIYLHIDGFEEKEISFKTDIQINYKDNYLWFNKGVLLYSYPISEKIEKIGDEEFPVYSLAPLGDWQYGLKEKMDCHYENGAIIVNAHKITNWKIKKLKKVKRCTSLYKKIFRIVEGEFIMTPNIPKKIVCEKENVQIALVPYMHTRLRLTAFPIVKD